MIGDNYRGYTLVGKWKDNVWSYARSLKGDSDVTGRGDDQVDAVNDMKAKIDINEDFET